MTSNKALYDVFNGWKQKAQKYTDWANLSHEDKTFVNEVLDEFKRAGIEQSEKTKKKIKQLDRDIEDLRD